MRRNLTKFDSLPVAVKDAIQSWVPIRGRRPPQHPERMACLAVMQAIARAWGGECLSQCYVGRYRPLTFRCKLGHVWQGSPASLLHGSFCPLCYNRGRQAMESIQAYAKSRGFACLSDQYVDQTRPLRWQCGKGHEWIMRLNYLRRGRG